MTKGQRIKSRRNELNISQTELAKRIGVSKQTLYKYENDIITNVPSDNIEKLSAALSVSPAWIMGFPESATTSSVLSSEDIILLNAYHNADSDVQFSVRVLLGIKKESNSTLSKAE